MISSAASAVTWKSLRANSNPRSKDGGKSEVCRIDGNVKLKTLVESLDHGNLQFYPGDYIAKIPLSTYPVSTCTAERSFRSMKRLKTPLRSTMTDGRLSSIAILHIHKRKDVDLNDVITEFTRLKGRRLALCL